MMMSATSKKIFSPIEILEKGILGAKTWFFIKKKKKMSKIGIIF